MGASDFKSKLNVRSMRKHASLLRRRTALDGAVIENHGFLVSINPYDFVVTLTPNRKQGEKKALRQLTDTASKFIQMLYPDASKIVYRHDGLEIDLSIVDGPTQTSAEKDAAPLKGETHNQTMEDKVVEKCMDMNSENAAKSQRDLFSVTNTGCLGLLYLRLNIDIDPLEFMLKLFAHIESMDLSSRQKLISDLSATSVCLFDSHCHSEMDPNLSYLCLKCHGYSRSCSARSF